MTTISIWAEDGKGRFAHKEYEGLNEDLNPFLDACRAQGLTHIRLTRDKD